MKPMLARCLSMMLVLCLLLSLAPAALMEGETEAQPVVVEEAAPTVDGDDQAEPAEEAAEPASDDAAEPGADEVVPDEDIEAADVEITSEPVDAIVEESEDTDLSMLEAQDIDDELDLDALEDDITDDDGSAMHMEPMGGTIDLNNSEVIPDARFRAYLAYTYDTDRNGVLSEAEIANVTNIYTDGVQSMDEEYYQAHAQELENAGVNIFGSAGDRYITWDIQEMTGFRQFPNLRVMNLGGNIPELDISNMSSLEYAYCDNIHLISLNASGCVNLRELGCESNQIKTLKLNGCTSLYELWCQDNQLESLDLSDCVALKYLRCEKNKLTTLDVDSCSNLTTLECYSNSLSSLNVNLCVNLIRLDCSTNPLTSLNVSNSPLLEQLICNNCGLSSLTLNNPLLYVLLAYGNNLTELNIENSPDLVYASNTEAQTDANFGASTLIYTDDLQGIQYRDFNYYCLAVDNTVTLVPAPDDTHIVELTPANFEDGKFLEFVKSNYDKNKDNWLSQSEIADVTVMQLNHYDPATYEIIGMGITSLKGIEFFSALKELDCGYNELTTLDLSQNTGLKEVICWDNKLTILNVAGLSRLTRLSCSNNQLKELNVGNNRKLWSLSCSSNQLSTINLDNNPKLEDLWIEGNQITVLDISNCPQLVRCYKSCINNGDYIHSPGHYIQYSIDTPVVITCDDFVTIITEKNIEPAAEPSPADVAPAPAVVAPAPAPAPAPAAPAEPITINKTPASTKAKAKKGKVTVTWKKIKKTKKTKALLGQIKSVQVQYSTDPNFAANVVTRTVGKKKTKVTLKGLQKKTVYYIRVRYVGAGGVSNWSAVKRVKTKK